MPKKERVIIKDGEIIGVATNQSGLDYGTGKEYHEALQNIINASLSVEVEEEQDENEQARD